MSHSKIVYFAIIFLILVSKLPLSASSLQVDETEASVVLTEAQNSVVLAYDAVVAAEHADADVQHLTVQLNQAAEYLSRAEVAFKLGNLSDTISFSSLSLQISEVVRTRADELKLQAYGPRNMGVWVRITVAILGMVAVGLGSLVAWRIFKRRYTERVLEMKPEVASDES